MSKTHLSSSFCNRIMINLRRIIFPTLHQAAIRKERGFTQTLLSRDDFLVRLREERLRSERTNHPVALIAIDYSGLVALVTERNGVSTKLLAHYVASAIKTCTRRTDIKGWYDDGRIGLLAPSTDEQGAKILAEKLVTALADSLSYDGSKPPERLGPFFFVSSLEVASRCLRSSKAVEPAKPKTQEKKLEAYRFESDSSPFASAYYMPVQRGDGVAVAPWPLPLELVPQIRGRELRLLVKRLVDMVGSAVAIVLFSPIMIFLAILVKTTSPGPALFRQERLGLMGKSFTFVKFRSMHTDADPSVHEAYVKKLINGQNSEINKGTAVRPLYKLNEDPRVTPVGRFLRKTSLDELPQFFNVLMGDMSLVGPRPPIPYECEAYKGWHCRRVLEAKPGITGLWQVNGRSSTTFDEMVRLDLRYSRSWSLSLDVKILLKTLWAVMSGRGAY